MLQQCSRRSTILTPFTIRLPTRVTNPLTLSDRAEDTTSVDPGSWGANSAMHSSRPLFSDASVCCSEASNHSSSRACHVSDRCCGHEKGSQIYDTSVASSSFTSSAGDIGGQTAIDMALELLHNSADTGLGE